VHEKIILIASDPPKSLSGSGSIFRFFVDFDYAEIVQQF